MDVLAHLWSIVEAIWLELSRWCSTHPRTRCGLTACRLLGLLEGLAWKHLHLFYFEVVLHQVAWNVVKLAGLHIPNSMFFESSKIMQFMTNKVVLFTKVSVEPFRIVDPAIPLHCSQTDISTRFGSAAEHLGDHLFCKWNRPVIFYLFLYSLLDTSIHCRPCLPRLSEFLSSHIMPAQMWWVIKFLVQSLLEGLLHSIFDWVVSEEVHLRQKLILKEELLSPISEI